MVKGVEFLMKKNKIDVYYGYGFFVDKYIVSIVKEDGFSEEIILDKIIIVMGFKFIVLVVFNYDKEWVIIFIEVFNIDEVFKCMVFVGGGVIGLELGFVFVCLGIEVEVVEFMDCILFIMDKDCGKELMCVLKKIGVKFYFKYKVSDVKVNKKSVIVMVEKWDVEEIFIINVDYCLVVIGCYVYIDKLGFENVGI